MEYAKKNFYRNVNYMQEKKDGTVANRLTKE